MRKQKKNFEQIPLIHPNAAGLDIASNEIWGCVPPNRSEVQVRQFSTFTPDLHRLADWLVACQVDTVAMESTISGEVS